MNSRSSYADLFNSRLKIRHLIIALSIAETGSTIAAAESLLITQPAITRALRELEEILGAQLFDRTSRGMVPTEMATVFLEHAAASLAHLRTAGNQVNALAAGEFGEVRIGVHIQGTNLLLPRAIARFKEDFPKVSVIVRTDVPSIMHRRLAEGEIDLAITRLTNNNPTTFISGETIAAEVLLDDPVVLVTSIDTDLDFDREYTLADLIDHRWVLPVRDTSLRLELEGAFRLAGTELPAEIVECTSPTTVHALVREGGFIATMSKTSVEMLSDVKVLNVTDCHIVSRSGVLRSIDQPLNPAADALRDYLHEIAAELEQF